jgi:hypothetical protein
MTEEEIGNRFTCPCCGYLVFDEPPGSYEICPTCFWEDDALQLEFATTLAGGANRPSLLEAQRAYAALGVCEARFSARVRRPGPRDRQDPTWRAIDLSLDSFAPWGSSDHDRPPAIDERLYYWRPTFWRRQSK